MPEITDFEEALAWLETQPHQRQVWMASRAAMRTLPGVGFAIKHEAFDDLALMTLRAMLISGAAAMYPTPDMKDLESRATTTASAALSAATSAVNSPSARDSAFSVDSAASAAASAASAADSAGFAADVAYRCANAADSAAYFAFSADTNFHSATFSTDSEVEKGWPSLWHTKDMPDGLKQGWVALRDHLDKDRATWGFWLDWYEGCLNGTPMDWDLIITIALEMKDDDWDKSPTHVATRIREIRARFELEQRIQDLETVQATVVSEHARHGIGGNFPPEDIEVESSIVPQATIVWAAVADLKAEVQSEEPDKSVVSEAIETLGATSKAILSWCAKKGDLAVDTLIKWGIPAGAAALVARPDLIEAVIAAARAWLPFL